MKILRCWCSNPTGENFLLLIYSSLRSNTKLTTLTTLCITGKLEYKGSNLPPLVSETRMLAERQQDTCERHDLQIELNSCFSDLLEVCVYFCLRNIGNSPLCIYKWKKSLIANKTNYTKKTKTSVIHLLMHFLIHFFISCLLIVRYLSFSIKFKQFSS